MYTSKIFKTTLSAFLIAVSSYATATLNQGNFSKLSQVGTETSPSELVSWDISVFYDGENLPKGQGNLEEGEEIYAARCAMCHGDFGEGANRYPILLGAEKDELTDAAIDGERNVTMRGINNFWGHAPTLYDTIRRAMPYFAPQSLSDDQTYSVTGYVLMLAEVIDEDVEVIDAEFLKSIKMPAADLFVTDDRPDTFNSRCMKDCYDVEPETTYNVLEVLEDS
ncbi:MAG TPA: cytochrome c [Gammaproteobacteria bacterium]|nr:cytochrome c [Gammaproteobacteria bacterium]